MFWKCNAGRSRKPSSTIPAAHSVRLVIIVCFFSENAHVCPVLCVVQLTEEEVRRLTDAESQKVLWDMMSVPLPKGICSLHPYSVAVDETSIQQQFATHVLCTLARTRYNLNEYGAYQAAAYW